MCTPCPRKQKLRLKIMEKILERERLDGSQKSKFGSQVGWLVSYYSMFRVVTKPCHEL